MTNDRNALSETYLFPHPLCRCHPHVGAKYRLSPHCTLRLAPVFVVQLLGATSSEINFEQPIVMKRVSNVLRWIDDQGFQKRPALLRELGIAPIIGVEGEHTLGMEKHDCVG